MTSRKRNTDQSTEVIRRRFVLTDHDGYYDFGELQDFVAAMAAFGATRTTRMYGPCQLDVTLTAPPQQRPMADDVYDEATARLGPPSDPYIVELCGCGAGVGDADVDFATFSGAWAHALMSQRSTDYSVRGFRHGDRSYRRTRFAGLDPVDEVRRALDGPQ